jgi:hypothetical protein
VKNEMPIGNTIDGIFIGDKCTQPERILMLLTKKLRYLKLNKTPKFMQSERISNLFFKLLESALSILLTIT